VCGKKKNQQRGRQERERGSEGGEENKERIGKKMRRKNRGSSGLCIYMRRKGQSQKAKMRILTIRGTGKSKKMMQ